MESIPITYDYYAREEWANLNHQKMAIPLSEEELQILISTQDQLNLQDIQEIYLPLLHYLTLIYEEYRSLQQKRASFLQKRNTSIPFIIGIAGSVAVGKSTLARVLQVLLERIYGLSVSLVTTDGFLYSKSELEQKGLLDRKGFPESYNMPKLLHFLEELKVGKKEVHAPIYSHEKYDIIPDDVITICEPDIVIVEGINVLQNPWNERIYISDFFDFSIYLDAEIFRIQQWYCDRFLLLRGNEFATKEEAIRIATKVWKSINEKNLLEYILPTKYRADLILHKTESHFMDYILLKK